ncbi:PREDICTED: syntaxin-binding protein 5-like [Amphimedon queenslandica]|uniref:V-SNARE coiled-coil homology domain-containing protein n=1 Tax=Amphimedon queenslandica TaxID=400682 RepID=A0AAN0JV16_AMPQE|nr:PREDICTED: syntaxin-binding protein 5-like [Amphimedon queenslandica]|eukprot:XP_019860750.1 PREDICTED: syntaxin-binding protein 5-like [Amphimedon queenslandica]
MFVVGVEAAGKAWKSVATRHDLLAVKEKERETKGKRGGKGGGGASSTDGSGNAFTQARQKLDKRGEDLSRIEEQTEKLATDADDFASVAERLAEKYRKKRF